MWSLPTCVSSPTPAVVGTAPGQPRGEGHHSTEGQTQAKGPQPQGRPVQGLEPRAGRKTEVDASGEGGGHRRSTRGHLALDTLLVSGLVSQGR